jgi:hypothetical protein
MDCARKPSSLTHIMESVLYKMDRSTTQNERSNMGPRAAIC